MRSILASIVLSLALVVQAGAVVHGAGPVRRADVSWISDSDGFWDVGANWSTGTAPEPGDDVTIDRPGSVTVHRHCP